MRFANLVMTLFLALSSPLRAATAFESVEPAEGDRPAGTTFSRGSLTEACGKFPIKDVFRRKETSAVRFWVRGETESRLAVAPSLPITVTATNSSDRVTRISVEPGPWREIRVIVTPENDADANSASLRFCLSGPWRSLSLAGFHGESDARLVGQTSQPSTTAAWRAAALERVRRRWQVPAALSVVDAKGRPKTRGVVKLVLRTPDFHLGTAVDAALFVRDDPRGDDYRQQILQHFDSVTFENALKWVPWETDRALTRKAVARANAMGLRVYGHTLLWPSWQKMPPGVEQMSDAEARARIHSHIIDEVSALRGQVVLWDVVNEPAFERTALERLGDGLVREAFDWAKLADGKADLRLNEAFRPGELEEERYSRIESVLGRPIVSRAVDSLGVQGHYAWRRPSIEAVVADLDRLSGYGRPLDITEFDFATFDESEKARFLEEMLLAAAGHRNVRSFTFWGFRSDLHWRPEAALFDENGTAFPAGAALERLPIPKTGTRYAGKLDAKGTFKGSVFSGDYDVFVDGKDEPYPVHFDTTRRAARVRISQ